MNKKKYCRLCAEDRKVIHNMSQGGSSQTEVGQAIGFSQGTISKKLSRNKGRRGYRGVQAQRFADERQREKRSRPQVVS